MPGRIVPSTRRMRDKSRVEHPSEVPDNVRTITLISPSAFPPERVFCLAALRSLPDPRGPTRRSLRRASKPHRGTLMRPRTLAVALLVATALAVRVGASAATPAAPASGNVVADSAAIIETPAPGKAASDSVANGPSIVLEERPDADLAKMFLGRVVELGVGMVSYYASRFHGRRTASGTTYDETEMTAAHRTLPFGTLLKVTNLTNLKSVIVRVTDRGPYIGNRILDLSRTAAREIGMLSRGVVKMRVERVQD